MKNLDLSDAALKTVLQECRQCGICCKKYKRVLLQGDEVDYIKKMGGHVGVDATLRELREKPINQLIEENREKGKVYMVHPDEQGCIFMEQRNSLFYCKIYHYRPLSCRGFRCNLADESFLSLFAGNAIHLLGQDTFGLPLDRNK